jgi:anti-anti-sigma regulatory factor
MMKTRACNTEVRVFDDYSVLLPSGYFNAGVGSEIEKVCDDLINHDHRYFIINFSRVEMINTIGISILVNLINKVCGEKGVVYCTEIGVTNREVFEVLHLNQIAMILPTDEAAIQHMSHDRDTTRRNAGTG